MPDFRAVFPEDAMKNCVFKAIILKGNADLVVFDNTGTDLNAHNVNDAIVELNDKIGHSTDDYYTKEETDAKLELKADASELANYYTKSESDSLLAEKADASSVYTKSETDDMLALKADADSVYTKQEADGLLDLKADESELANYYTKTESDNLLDAKADSSSVYTKQETNDLLSAKVDSTTLATDYYDKSDVNSLLSVKANADAVYTKEETEAEISALIVDDHIANNKAWSSEKISKEIYDILPTEEASGAIANFNTSLTLPLVSVKAYFEATQEAGTPTPQSPKAISGVSEVSVFHCHKNLYNYDESNVTTGTTTTSSTRAYYPLGFKGVSSLTFSAKLKSGSSITASDYLNIGKLRKSDGLIEILNQLITPDGITTRTLSISSDDEVVLTSLENPTFIKSILSRYDIQIEAGSTATTYEAYNGTTTLINLGGTYYGGYVEQDKDGHRQLVVTWCNITDLGSLNWWASNGGRTICNPSDMAIVPLSSIIGNILSDCYTPDTHNRVWNMITDNTIAVTDNINAKMVLYDSNMGTKTSDEVKAYLSGKSVIYGLAEPFTVALPDGEPITAFNGVNNLWSDTGNTTAEYKLSIEEYVAKKIAEITDGNRSLNTSLLRGSGDEREDITLPSSDELEREAIEEPERDDSQR